MKKLKISILLLIVLDGNKLITENIGNLGKINLLISKDIKSRHPNTYTRLQDISMDNYKISVKYKHSHVKIYLFDC